MSYDDSLVILETGGPVKNIFKFPFIHIKEYLIIEQEVVHFYLNICNTTFLIYNNFQQFLVISH